MHLKPAMSILSVLFLMAAVMMTSNGIFVIKFSEDAAAKMIVQTLVNMDFELFNLTGKPIINSDYIYVGNIAADHLEGVTAHVKFNAGGKLTLTVKIRRMRCTVDVRGNLMQFISVNDRPVVEFFNSTLDLHIAMGNSGANAISFVTFCDMRAERAVVTSQHWAVNIAKIKVVPLLTSGPHLKNKVCPYIEEKLLGNTLPLIGVSGQESIVINDLDVVLYVADRGVTQSHLYVVFQDVKRRDDKLTDLHRDLVLQPLTQHKHIQICIENSFIYNNIESAITRNQSEYEDYLNKHFTLRKMKKHFKALRRRPWKLTDYMSNWKNQMQALPLQTERGMTLLPVQTTLSLNVTSNCASYTLLQFYIDIEITLSSVAKTTDILFYIEKWRERVKCITSQIGDVSDLPDMISEFKLYEWFYPLVDVISSLGLSSLVPSRLALYDVTTTLTQNYLVIEADIDLLENPINETTYVHHRTEPECDVSDVNVTYFTRELEMCSNKDRTIIVQYVDESQNITTEGAVQTSDGVVTSLCFKLQCKTYFVLYFILILFYKELY